MDISFHTSKQARTDKQLAFYSCVSTYGINPYPVNVKDMMSS